MNATMLNNSDSTQDTTPTAKYAEGFSLKLKVVSVSINSLQLSLCEYNKHGCHS